MTRHAKPEGTRRLTKAGYIQVKVNGLRRWPFEHRLVWEAANGPIQKGAIIHHINHIKTDNSLENLICVANNTLHHKQHHADLMVRIGQHMGQSGKGKPKSPEHRTKIGLANKGRPKTMKHRENIRQSIIEWYKKRS